MVATIKVGKIAAAAGTTVNVESGHTITGAAGSIVVPGQVLQCVQYYANYSGAQTTTSTSFVASGIKKTITPKASGNLIIVQASISMAYADSHGWAKLYMNGSVMSGAGNYQMGYINNNYNTYSGMAMQAQHTTTSTSALEFEVYIRVGATGTFTYVHSSASAALTLWEIAQ